jgi:WD40 repeat protein
MRQPQQRGKAGTAAGQFCTKSILANPAHFLAAHPCGDFIFICSDNKMFVWEVHGGQLLCMVEEHVREVSAMRISSCGNFLATASQDGAVKMYLTARF